jgi:hypothetical protein
MNRVLVLAVLALIGSCPTQNLPGEERAASAPTADGSNRFEGEYCEGAGDVAYLRLIDESFAFFHANPVVPNLTMVYQPDWDTFEERNLPSARQIS